MLRGIDVGDIKGSMKEAALLQALDYEEAIAHVRTLIGFKGAKLDNTDPEAVENFNKLLGIYDNLRNPETEKEREEAVAKASEDINKLMDLDLSKLKIGGNATHKGIKKIL